MTDKKIKVLVVDDEYSFCKNLRNFLTREGCEALLTTNGQQALDMVKDEKPDIMTLDIRMPGMNGYEVLEKLKWEKGLSIIVVSAIDAPDMEEKLIHAGASAVLHKPVDLKQLSETIKKLYAEKAK